MLNEKALKKVGPSYEEVGFKKETSATPNSDTIAATIMVSALYTTTIAITGAGKKGHR